jgi:hypothetical protein
MSCHNCKYGPTWEQCDRPERDRSVCYLGSHWKRKGEEAMKQQLTEAQQEIYDAVKPEEWFSKWDISYVFRNVESQCHKMVEKGFMESRLVNDYHDWQFKRLKERKSHE